MLNQINNFRQNQFTKLSNSNQTQNYHFATNPSSDSFTPSFNGLKKLGNKGLTLVETVVIGTIVAILAVMAEPSYESFKESKKNAQEQVKTAETEAKMYVRDALDQIGANYSKIGDAQFKDSVAKILANKVGLTLKK